MPLIDLQMVAVPSALPANVRAFLREAARRIRRFRLEHHVPGFVPSDFQQMYHVLRALNAADAVAGRRFCEWGSGFGVVACLAALLGYDSCGIEIEDVLVDAAQQLADDFGLPVEFMGGSFIPRGGAAAGSFSWLTTREGTGHDDPGWTPEEFDVIFAYPWPDEEMVVEQLFDRFAADGAVLVTFHEVGATRIRQKKAAKDMAILER
jgi:predicted nicotinamide N-methyase